MWKKTLVFLMIICLVFGIVLDSNLYSRAEEQKDTTTESQKQETEETTVSFEKLNSMVGGSSNLVENATVTVYISRNNTLTATEISTGVIAENIPQQMESSHFVGAYVVTDNGQAETEIAYIGSYTDEEDGSVHTYYAFSSDMSTGILLKEDQGQYIKLVYKDSFNLTYKVQLEDGTPREDGGTFYDRKDTVDYGNNVRIQFKANKNGASGNCAYVLAEVKAIASDGTETEIELDEDGYGYLNSVTQNMTIIAKVKKIEQYKLVVDEQIGGHVCWAGHSDEKNSNTKDPYSVNPKLFCSYREEDGATVTAAPGGTIYFVLYSQAWSVGQVWEFKSLTINGKPVDPIYDGNEYTTDLGNGMIAHFRYMGYDKSAGEDRFKDRHLKDNSILGLNDPADKERCKYECWIENVSEDIHVKFENFDSKNHEIVKLAEADGIEEVCASTFDRRWVFGSYTGALDGLLGKKGYYNFWLDLYDPVKKVGNNISDEEYKGNLGILGNPDAPYAQTWWGPGLITGAVTGQYADNWLFSDRAHVEIKSEVYVEPDDERTQETYGSRYIYFKTKPGYDPRTLDAQITGKDEDSSNTSGRIKLIDVDDIANLVTTNVSSKTYNKTCNASLEKAKQKGYQWYVSYEGCGINVRNLYLKCEPYQFGVEYDLNGGTWKDGTAYADDNRYTIGSGSNKISLPNQNPVQEGKVFTGWKLVPLNEGYTGTANIYDVGDVFKITDSNYEAALETERIEYQLPVISGGVDTAGEVTYEKHVDYSPIKGGNHRFRFVAQWAGKEDITAKRAEYSVKIYKEAAPGTENAVEVDGKTYTVEEKTHLGIKGEDIISIQDTPEGYVLDKEKSVTKLKNFMKDGNTANEILYYYYIPEWKVEQTTNPQGGENTGEAAKVKIGDTIEYTISVQNPEKADVILPQGTVITAVLPEGLISPENVKASEFDYLYDETTRTITYTLRESTEIAAGESIELQYSAKAGVPGMFENQAKMITDWKTCESNKLYHTTVADLTITNTTVGKYADYNKKFKVTITLTDTEGNALSNKEVKYKGGKLSVAGGKQAPADGYLIFNADNQANIYLKHGQTITLKDIPYGYRYTVTQEDAKGYTTTYSGTTSGFVEKGEFFPGTNIPIVTDAWPDVNDFTDEYEKKTLSPSGIFRYGGEYYVVCREYKGLTKGLAEQGPGGDLYNWYCTEKLTGTIVEVEDNTNSLHPVKRGDIIKYKGEYYVFNDGGEWSGNPENNDRCYKLSGGLRVDITNTCEDVSPTGVFSGGDNVPIVISIAVVLTGLGAAGYILNRRKRKHNI